MATVGVEEGIGARFSAQAKHLEAQVRDSRRPMRLSGASGADSVR